MYLLWYSWSACGHQHGCTEIKLCGLTVIHFRIKYWIQDIGDETQNAQHLSSLECVRQKANPLKRPVSEVTSTFIGVLRQNSHYWTMYGTIKSCLFWFDPQMWNKLPLIKSYCVFLSELKYSPFLLLISLEILQMWTDGKVTLKWNPLWPTGGCRPPPLPCPLALRWSI